MENKENILTNPFIALLAVTIAPIVNFCWGYIIGLLVKFLIGGAIVTACSFLHINITVSDIPLLCAFLYFVGSFFGD